MPNQPVPEESVVGERELWEAIDSLRSEMGEHRGGAHPVWETWCEENGVDWEDLRAAANAYLPAFKQWLDDSCLGEAAVDMWLHAFQVGLLVARKQEREQVLEEIRKRWRKYDLAPVHELEALLHPDQSKGER